MNKNDYKMIEEAYNAIFIKENETPEEMEGEKVDMVETDLRKGAKHAILLLQKIEEGSIEIPPWAEEKLAIATNMLTNMADTLMSRKTENKISDWRRSQGDTEY